MSLRHGIRDNRVQFAHQLLQVLLVGLTLGMTRTVVPALAEAEFHVPRDSFVLLAAFVVAFGVVKGAMNFVAGRLSETVGRKRVLLLGWLLALPIPVLVWWAPAWHWIVVATLLLGVNQGLTWSMTQTAKLDLTRADERGLTLGLNEFAGYTGVALAGVATAYLAETFGARTGLLWFGLGVIVLALWLTHAWVEDTLPWARAAGEAGATAGAAGAPSARDVFARMSWRDRRLAALSQAGLVEKFVDALVWVLYPLFLYQRGVPLPEIGWIVGVYGFTWGGAQLFTGRLSDRIGRQWPNVAGMWICGAGVAMLPLGEGSAWWSLSAAVSGLGMALLYPNLSAAVADLAAPAWRGSAIGIYRFWRDLGYAIGGLGLGLVAQRGGGVEAAFWFVAGAMFVSGALLWWWGEESHPRLRHAGPAGPGGQPPP
ncbi:MFS transporter [Vulcaniibacterium gelatinicum]|uniref:MFS transporter n=1 Tax=Vulcaniibacterium gelatinicum TaxID=2598725 RepID=UPI001C70AC81|nr:MFS transporter [Vulcaniibacterium gelatinicum]